MSADVVADELAAYAAHKLRQNFSQLARCARSLTPEQLWQRASPRNNSVGNLILHLTGNLRQWIVGGVAGASVDRDRQAEFAQRGPLPLEPILAEFERVVGTACDVISRLGPADLASPRSIQDYDVVVVVAVMHVVEHFSWHTGQIVHMTKTLCDADLAVYDAGGHRLDHVRNRP